MKKLFAYFLFLVMFSSLAFAQNGPEQCLVPIDAMLVIDRSGSMNDDNKLTDAKAAASAFVGAVDFSQDEVGLASFNQTATLDQELTNVEGDVTSAINALKAGGLTNIGGGIKKGREELLANGGPTKAMVLLSDGAPNVDGSGGICGSFDIGNACALYSLSEATATKNAGIELFVIGLGVDSATEDLLQQIATDNLHYFAASSADLDEIYLTIAEELCPDGPICGDFIVDEGEECDDGNTQDGDGCSAECTTEFNEIPEFTTIGAGLALAGIGAYMYRKRSRK
ncbi:VWA domain-containing protein [Candidatus Woesearchaeota archaeon]|nr:VWA domain-containing protein [Candidatus Woesearchaeota archaeon]